jgi:hypothetical protein
MKQFLLATLALLISSTMYAQYVPENKAEVGVNCGWDGMSLPNVSSISMYSGKQATSQMYYSVRGSYDFTQHLQAGMDIGMTQWETSDKWFNVGADGHSYGNTNVRYVFGNPTFNFMLSCNYFVPFYSRYREMIRSKFYCGVTAGLAIATNDGENKLGINPADSSVFTHEYHYQSGKGMVMGAQVGYIYYVSQHVGLNIDAAARFADMSTIDPRYGTRTDKYNLWYFPVTFGIHYRWGTRDKFYRW